MTEATGGFNPPLTDVPEDSSIKVARGADIIEAAARALITLGPDEGNVKAVVLTIALLMHGGNVEGETEHERAVRLAKACQSIEYTLVRTIAESLLGKGTIDDLVESLTQAMRGHAGTEPSDG